MQLLRVSRFAAMAASLLITIAPAAAQRKRPAPNRDLVLLEVAPGGSLTFFAKGNETARLTALRVVSAQRSAAANAADVAASLQPLANGGRWIRVTASRKAKPGAYRIEGLAGKKPSVVLPIALRVTKGKSRQILAEPRATAPRLRVPRTGPANKLAKRAPSKRTPLERTPASATSIAKRKAPIATDFRVTDIASSTAYRKVLEKDGQRVRADPRLNFRGDLGLRPKRKGGIKIEGVVVGAMDPRSWTPSPKGWALDTLTIEGAYLNESDMQLRLGSLELKALPGANATRVEYRLPPRGMTGKLTLRRRSDGKQATLATNYEVRPAFAAFDHDANGHHLRNAYLLSLLSWTCYQDEDDVLNIPETGETRTLTQAWSDWGLEMVGEPIQIQVDPLLNMGPSGMTEAYVLRNDKCVFVTFRGSTDHNWFQDWYDNDLDLRPLPVPSWNPNGGPLSIKQVVMHKGFYDAAMIAYSTVRDRVESARGNRKVWITGHSLGGAVAVITAFKLAHDNGVAIQGVHAFGAPPVGNGVWQVEYDALLPHTWRWNVENDPVPVLYQAPAFYHVGKVNNLHLDGKMKTEVSTMFGYVPNAGSIDDLAVKHMSYWHRMFAHDSVQELSPKPPAPPTW